MSGTGMSRVSPRPRTSGTVFSVLATKLWFPVSVSFLRHVEKADSVALDG